MKKRTMLAPAILAQAFAVGAQGVPEGGDSPSLEPVTATARRSIEQRFFSAGSLVVIDRRDIEQLGAFSVADVLRQLPSVVVTTSGDGSVEIRMRGMERSATQLLVDGQRVSSGRSQLPLDQLPAEMIERVEVVRAPTAEFSGATGGTINIVLRQATAKRETVIRLTDNAVWGRHAGQAFFSRTGPLGAAPPPSPKGEPLDPAELDAQRWSYFLALSTIGYILGSDAHRSVSDSSGTTETDPAGRYRRRDVSIVPRLTGKLGAADQVALRATMTKATFGGQFGGPGTTTSPGGAVTGFSSNEFHTYDREYLQAGGDWTHRFAGSKLETAMSMSRARETIDRNGGTSLAGGAPVSSYAFRDDRQEDLWTLSTKLSGTTSPLLWTVGAQAERRRLDVDNQTGGVPLALDAVLERNVLWGQNEWDVLDGSTLTAGLRGETLEVRSAAVSALLAQRRSSFLQPSLHLRTPIGEELQFRANLARITRNPRIWDLVDRTVISQGTNSIVNPDTIGNPGLRPEVSWTLDAGFEKRLAKEGQAGVNLFIREVSDAIAPVSALNAAGRWVEQRINAGDARVWGIELDAKTGLTWAGLGRDWTLSANASLLQSRMTSGVNAGNRIPGQARYTANVTVAKPMRRTGGFFGGGTLTLTGPADLDSSPGVSGREASRTTLDVYIGSLVRGLGYWRVGIFNITDSSYRRSRTYVDAAGGQGTSASRLTLTPRVYLTVGTQF
jgi:outer membrane receptor for ferrienterochelin and colicins